MLEGEKLLRIASVWICCQHTRRSNRLYVDDSEPRALTALTHGMASCVANCMRQATDEHDLLTISACDLPGYHRSANARNITFDVNACIDHLRETRSQVLFWQGIGERMGKLRL
jgi:hypothetical protein